VLSILHLGSITYVAGTFTQVVDHSGDVLAGRTWPRSTRPATRPPGRRPPTAPCTPW
jgi:hypothetical protein